MAGRSSFHFRGAKDLNKALAALGPETATKAGASASRKAANIMRVAVKDAAPRGTQPSKKTWRTKDGVQKEADYGRLHENIKTRKQKSKKAHTIRYIVSTENAFWGRFSEFGTEHEPARPWFGPAIEQIAGKVVDALSDELGRAINRAARKARKS